MAAGPTPAEVPSWRVDILFLAFVVVSFLLTKGDHLLLTYLTKRDKIGFIHIYEALKEEILLVGIISLLLTGFQDALASICVSAPRLDSAFPPFSERGGGTYSADEDYTEDIADSNGPYGPAAPYASTPTARRLLEEVQLFLDRRRRILAESDPGSPCPEGSSQLFPVSVLHAVHIMLFLVAATQILYSCLVLILCLWKVSLWRKHEQRAQQFPGLLRHLDGQFSGCGANYRRLKRRALGHLTSRAKSNIAVHYGVASLLMFNSVNGEQYIVMRHIFLQNLGLENDFDFLEFVKESMEEEFASMVGVNTLMWMVLFLWIALPPESYVSVWIPILMLVLAMVLGAKLSSVMLIFNHQARQAWATSAEAQKEIEARQKDMREEQSKTVDVEPVLWDDGAEEATTAATKEHVDQSAAHERRHRRTHSPAEVELSMHSTLHEGNESEEAEALQSQSQRSGEMENEAIEGPQRQCSEKNSGKALREIQSIMSWLKESNKARRGMRGGACWAAPATQGDTEERRAGDREGQVGEGMQNGAGNDVSRRRDRMEDKYGYRDSANLFWARRPYIILHLLQIVYFGMSMQLALSSFTVWQNLPVGYLLPVLGPLELKHDVNAPLTAGTILFVLATNLFILLWCAFNLLPVYALASTVGSHCPESVLSYAHRTHLQPKLTRALEAVAVLNAAALQESEAPSEVGGGLEHALQLPVGAQAEHLLDDIIDAHLDRGTSTAKSSGDAHGARNARAMQKLMGAMYSAQLKRYTEEASQQAQTSSHHPHGESTWHASTVAEPTESRPTFSQLRNAFHSDGEDIVGEKPRAPSTTPMALSDGGVAGPIMDLAALQRVALKQEFLLSIVGRQEELRQARDREALSTPHRIQAGVSKPDLRAPHAGLSLSRHSMKAAVSLDKQRVALPATRPDTDLATNSSFLHRRSYTPSTQSCLGENVPMSGISELDSGVSRSRRLSSLSRRSAAPKLQVEPSTSTDPSRSKPTGVHPPPGFSLGRASAGPRLGGSQRPGKADSVGTSGSSMFASSGPLFQQQTRANVANASIQLARASADPAKLKAGLVGHTAPSEQNAGAASQWAGPSTKPRAPPHSHDDSEVPSVRSAPPAGFSLRRNSMAV